jgi:hypothetical protein
VAVRNRTLGKSLDECRENARLRRVPDLLIDEALKATQRRFCQQPPTLQTGRRASAYFWAIVTRRSLRSGGAAEHRSRLVLDAVVHDMQLAGFTPIVVADELERGWTGVVSGDVLSEYRRRLCA